MSTLYENAFKSGIGTRRRELRGLTSPSSESLKSILSNAHGQLFFTQRSWKVANLVAGTKAWKSWPDGRGRIRKTGRVNKPFLTGISLQTPEMDRSRRFLYLERLKRYESDAKKSFGFSENSAWLTRTRLENTFLFNTC